MVERTVAVLTAGRWWVIKSLLFCVGAAFCCSCTPAIWMFRSLELPPAYELKAEQPFADTSLLTIPEHPGERSHGAKLTPRLLSSVLLSLSRKASLHPYWPASLGGVLLLLSGLIVGTYLSGDRRVGLMCSLIFAGLYASNACFAVNHGPKPFDGIALGSIAVTLMLCRWPVLMAIAAYMACWTDERAVVSLVAVAALTTMLPDVDEDKRYQRAMWLGWSVVLFGVSRVIASQALDWQPSDTSMLGDHLVEAFSFAQLSAWIGLEGAWVLVAAAWWYSGRSAWASGRWQLVCVTLLTIGSTLVVLDISRAAAFAFPVVFLAIALLQRLFVADETLGGDRSLGDRAEKSISTVASQTNDAVRDSVHDSGSVAGHVRLQRLTSYAAIVSLLAPNVEVISSIAFSPLPSTPIVVLLRALGG